MSRDLKVILNIFKYITFFPLLTILNSVLKMDNQTGRVVPDSLVAAVESLQDILSEKFFLN